MAGIADAMKSILTQLATYTITNGDNNVVVPYVRIWNNQLRRDENGNMQAFGKPAFFLEVLPFRYNRIGNGVRSADPTFRIHVIDEEYDAADGTMDQNLGVFTYRDDIVWLLTDFQPAGCGLLTSVEEGQDDKHNNLYHLTVDFITNFTDYKGSKNDPARNFYQFKQPPTDAVMTRFTPEPTASEGTSNPSETQQQQFRIPTQFP